MSHSAASLHKPTWNYRSKPCQTLWGVLASHLSMAVQQGFTFAFVYATCLKVGRDAFFFVPQKNPSGLMRSSRWGFAPLIFQNRCDCTRSAGSCWVCCCTPWHKQFQAPPAEMFLGENHTSCRKERVRGVSKMMKNTETPFILKKVIRNYLPGS